MCLPWSGLGKRLFPSQTTRFCDNRSRIEPLAYQSIAFYRHADPWVSGIRHNSHELLSMVRRGYELNVHPKYVHRLLVDDALVAKELLPLCSELKSLALWTPSNATNQKILHLLFASNGLSLPHLRRLSICWRSFPPDNRSFHMPIFQGLTHLDVNYSNEVSWSGLSSLQSLKYFRLDCLSAIQSADELEAHFETITKQVAPHLPSTVECCIVWLRSSLRRSTYERLGGGARARQFLEDVETGRYDPRVILEWVSLRANRPNQSHVGRGDRYMHFLCRMDDVIEPWAHLPGYSPDFSTEARAVLKRRGL